MSSRAIRSFEPLAPDAYLILAVELSESASESSRRSAIDRAYYAAFLTARNELDSKGYINAVRGPQTHAQVIVALTQADRNSGRALKSLRRTRNRLTYQTERINLPRRQSLQSLIESARAVIEAAQALPANSV